MTATSTRAERILSIFNKHGGQMPAEVLAVKCIEAGEFTDAELETAKVRWATLRCKQALRTQGEDGLPGALVHHAYEKDGDGNLVLTHTWITKRLWDAPVLRQNISDRISHANATLDEVYGLIEEAQRRFPDEDWNFSDEWPGGYRPR